MRLGHLLGGVGDVLRRHERAVGLAALQGQKLLLQAADQGEMLHRLVLVAGAQADIDRELHVVGPLAGITGGEGLAGPVFHRPRSCSLGRALDGAVDQAIEARDGGLGQHAGDKLLALLGGRHQHVHAARRLVQAVGIEALVVAHDAGAVLALIRGCRTGSFYRNFQNEFCAGRMPFNAQLSMHLIDQSLNKPHAKTSSLHYVKVGSQSRSVIAD